MKVSQENKQLITSMYLTGLSTRQIGGQLNIPHTTVANLVKKEGISRNKSSSQLYGCARKTSIAKDWSFLPLTAEKSWLLGLIYGDGSMSKQGYGITLTSSDFDVIDKVNNIFGKNLNYEDRDTYRILKINSRRLWLELHDNWNLVPDKSDKIKWHLLDDYLMPHFIRGLVDSDGGWAIDKRNSTERINFHYTSKCKEFVNQLRDFLVAELNVSKKRKLTQHTYNETYQLVYGHSDSMIIGEWIYRNTTDQIRNDRKYQIYFKNL